MEIAEALLRMDDAQMGSVPPSEFIPLAEELGIIGELGRWVLEQVCSMLHDFHQKGKEMPTISVNFSGLQFNDTRTVSEIIKLMEQYSIPPEKIEIELTETTFIGKFFDEALSVMKPLIDYGIKFHLDDFGTGYSNFSYLVNLPFQCIKIDKSILRHTKTKDSKYQFIASIIRIIKQMGFCTIVEGVENEEQFFYLQKNGCDMVQGYYTSPPIERKIFEASIESGIFHPLTKITQ